MAINTERKKIPGDIYVVTNDCFKKVPPLGRYQGRGLGLVSPVKIGRGVEFANRLGSLSSGVFDDFLVHLVLHSEDSVQSESDLHEYFGDSRIFTKKLKSKTEYFAGPIEDIIRRIRKYVKNHEVVIKKDYGVAGEPLGRSAISIKATLKKQGGTTKKKKDRFKYEMVGLRGGIQLVFAPTGAKVVAVAPNKVKEGGVVYTLTGYAKKYMPKDMRNAKDAYQGPAYFTYNGKKLTALREEMERT